MKDYLSLVGGSLIWVVFLPENPPDWYWGIGCFILMAILLVLWSDIRELSQRRSRIPINLKNRTAGLSRGMRYFQLTIGGRRFRFIRATHVEEGSVNGDCLCARVSKLAAARAGEEDARWLLKHASELPRDLKDVGLLAFPRWTTDNGENYALVHGYHSSGWQVEFRYRIQPIPHCIYIVYQLTEDGSKERKWPFVPQG